MAATAPTASPFSFTFGSALDDGSLYLAGVALELEDRDVPHTIIWERVAGNWQRYQWKNRTYATAAYESGGAGTAIYLGFEGTVKVRSAVRGSSEEIVDAGNGGPSSLRTLSSVRVIGDCLYVAGMRRIVYRRPSNAATWERFDAGLRLEPTDPSIAGLASIDGHDPLHLHAVGIAGEIWEYVKSRWNRLDSPTNISLSAVRCLPDGSVVVGGRQGTLLIGNRGQWTAVDHSFPDEIFSCIEWWRDRCFVSADDGALYELKLGDDPVLSRLSVQGVPSVSWVAATPKRVYFVGRTTVTSLGDDGWRDESPPAALLA